MNLVKLQINWQCMQTYNALMQYKGLYGLEFIEGISSDCS